MRKYFGIVLVITCLAACKHQTVFKEIQSPGKFSIQVPAYMKATDELFKDNKSCLQYESDSMQVYMLVFDTGRKDLNEKTLQEYYDSIVAEPTIPGARIASPKSTTVNNDSALVTEMTADLNGVPVFYRIEVIATPARFYYLLLWCRKDKKDDLKDDFEKVLSSFHDINR